jgi:hypothetical protein
MPEGEAVSGLDEAGFSMLVDTTSEPRCMSAERSMCGSCRPDWQQRVIDEKAELDARIGKLCDFFGSGAYRDLGDIDRHLLGVQLSHMRDYAHILGMRIARFG